MEVLDSVRALSRNDGEDQGAGMGGVVVDGVGGLDEVGACGGGLTGVQVAVEAREVAAGDFEADDVALEEDVAGGPEVDFVFVDLAGVEELAGPVVDSR